MPGRGLVLTLEPGIIELLVGLAVNLTLVQSQMRTSRMEYFTTYCGHGSTRHLSIALDR